MNKFWRPTFHSNLEVMGHFFVPVHPDLRIEMLLYDIHTLKLKQYLYKLHLLFGKDQLKF